MSDDRHCEPESDCFKPPAVPTEVHCLHCHEEYDSYLIHWVQETGPDGRVRGFWRCPTPGCGGAGFGFDIFPTDPDWVGEDGEPLWSSDETDEEEDILEYIYCGDSPRYIDPWSAPSPDEDEDEELDDVGHDAAMFDADDDDGPDGFFEPDDDNHGDRFDDDATYIDPWQPPGHINPAIPLGATTRTENLTDAPPHRIGPFYFDGSPPRDGVWEEDIPF